jgi:chaperonin GroES
VSVENPEKLPIRMLHDRVLVSLDHEAAERKSSAGIVIPATAAMGRRLAWARVVALGSNVRTVAVGDRVLFDPEDKAEVEVRSETYTLLRERDVPGRCDERREAVHVCHGLLRSGVVLPQRTTWAP